MNKQKFSERLKKLRNERDVSLNDIAAFLGIVRQSVHAWENMKAIPSLDKLQLLALYFDVSVDYLIGETDDPKIVSNEASEENQHRKDFSFRIAECRRQKKQSLQEVGEATSISSQRLSLLEKGERPPTFEELVKLADHFNVAFDFLLGDEEPPKGVAHVIEKWGRNRYLDERLPTPHHVPPQTFLTSFLWREIEQEKDPKRKEALEICNDAVYALIREYETTRKLDLYSIENNYLNLLKCSYYKGTNPKVYEAIRGLVRYDRNRSAQEFRKTAADILEESAGILRTDETEEERRERFNRLMLKGEHQ